MALSDAQIQHRCLCWGGSAQCRYLEQDRSNWRKYNCVKLMTGCKTAIDKAVAKHLKDCKANRIDPVHTYVAIGNGAGCPGYPYLPHVKQGYDVKKP